MLVLPGGCLDSGTGVPGSPGGEGALGLWPSVLSLGPAHGTGHRYVHKGTDSIATVASTTHTSFSTEAHRSHFRRFRTLGCRQNERAERGCRAGWDGDLLRTRKDTNPHLLVSPRSLPPPRSFTAGCAHPTLHSSCHLPPLPSFLPPPRFLPQSCSLLSVSVKHKPGPLPLLLRTCYGSQCLQEKAGVSLTGRRPCVLCSAP